jgi:hypothetical protein
VSAMSQNVSRLRLYLLRALYLLNFVGLGSMVWPAIFSHRGPWEPFHAVALCFWAALSTLMGLGVFLPLRMLPLVFLQLLYKSLWLTIVALPMWSAGQSPEFNGAMVAGVIADLIVIPWPYVMARYVKKRLQPEATLSEHGKPCSGTAVNSF